MTSDSEKKRLVQNQNTVRRSIVFALILLICSVTAAGYLPFPKLHLPTLFDRVVFTLRCSMLSLLSLVAGIQVLASIRLRTSAINPLDPSGQKFTQTFDRYLRNTVEQFLVHTFGLLVLSTYLSEGQMQWIVYLVVWFVIARAVFLVGYYIDPVKRAIGFAMTWLVNLVVVGYCLYCMCVYGVQASAKNSEG